MSLTDCFVDFVQILLAWRRSVSNSSFVHVLDDLVRGGAPHLEVVRLTLNGIHDSFGLEHLE